MAKWTKMSKSRGNVVLPEEVIKGVYGLSTEYEFRDLDGKIVDWKIKGVWFDITGYRTATKYGRLPVFLHQINNPVPVYLTDIQHPNELEFWSHLLDH